MKLTFIKRHVTLLGFTLVEVLITLLIIGAITAIVIPILLKDIDKQVYGTQLKTAVGIFQSAIKKATYDNGNIPYQCSLYNDGARQPFTCTYYPDLNIYKCFLFDGSQEPPDNRWGSTGCSALYTALKRNFNIIKQCSAGQGVTQGCMPEYKSYEEVIRLNNPSVSDDSVTQSVAGCGNWSRSSFNSSISSFVLNNGMIVFYASSQFPAIDTNGKKGPNKWGYDVFTLTLFGSKENGNTVKVTPDLRCIQAEPGGYNATTLLKDS